MLANACRIFGDGIGFYNNQRPHQALAMKTPAEVFALAAQLEQKALGYYM
jgi:putative transposase